MLDVFLEIIAPVLVMAALGGFVGRRFGVPAEVISNLAFNLFGPALVFSTLSTLELTRSTARTAIATVTMCVSLAIVSLAVSFVRGHDAPTRASVALGASVWNAGNMGLPVALLAFGEPGLEIGVLVYVVASMWGNSAGVVLASLAGGSARGALVAPLRVPALWAAAAGLIVNLTDVGLPEVVEVPAATLGGAAIPAMLVVLGLQLRFDVGRDGVSGLAQMTMIRLVGGPLIGLAATELLGVEGIAQDYLIIAGGMPIAVMTVVLATQYGARANLLSRAIVLTTMLSIVTLTVLISIVT